MSMKPQHLLAAAFTLAVALGAGLPALAASGGASGSGAMPSASGPSIDAVKRYQDGVAALQAAKYKDAEKAFSDVLTVAARDPNANFMLGLALAGQDNFKDARKAFEKAVRFNGEMAVARGWLGKVAAKLGDAKEAGAQKTALDALKAKCAGACKDAAAIDAAVKQIDDALANPAAQLTPQHAAPQLAAADGDRAYLSASGLINQGRYDDALASLREAALVFGPHPDILTYEGFANRKLGRYATAVGFYSAALALEPNHRGANEYLGEYYVEVGDLSKARLQLSKLNAICTFGCEEAEELRRWIEAKRAS